MKLFIESKQKKDGGIYRRLVADLGYTQQVLTFDDSILLLLSELTPKEFYNYFKDTDKKLELK